MSDSFHFHPDVRSALQNNRPVLALESTIISHGMPYPENVEFARQAEILVRKYSVVPATIAIINGKVHVGLNDKQLEILANSNNVEKIAVRDIAFAITHKLTGATTVSVIMRLANLAGIDVFATGGIGSVMAAQFADADAKVIVHYNSQQAKAESLCKKLAGKGHIIIGGDLANPNAIDKIVEQALSAFGRIDVLVNNAGVYFEHPINKIDFSEWQSAWNRTIDTNLIGPANLTFRVAKEMIKQGGGKIINISSRGAFRGEPTAPAYGASKAGLNAMGQSLAIALAPHNIFIYTIAPGFVETAMARPHLTGARKKEILNQSPLGRVAKPEEIAKTAVFLASEGTDFLTGCIIDVNGASYLR